MKGREQNAVTAGGARQRLCHKPVRETFEQVAELGRWKVRRRHSHRPGLTGTSA
jgi:hypothetical protein